MAALGSPLLQTALPLRVSAFSLQGSDPSKVQLLIHAEVGRGYSSPAPVSLAYVIADANDRIVESQTAAGRLSPIMSGVPSALQFVAGASLPPGVYKLKLAAAEGDRSGSVEHPIRAGLVAAGPINLSELFVGGPVDGGRAALRPTVAPTVHFGVVHGYVEAYGAGVDRLVMRYEIAARADGPAILEAETAGQPAGPERAIFTQMLPVRQLPPGAYTLRALLASGEAAAPDAPPVKVMTRAFTIAPPPVLMTSAENPGATVAPADVFLPVPEAWFERPFHREDASRPDTVRTFRERVDPSARTAFDDGVGHLTSGDYVRAEESFKSVIQVQTESTGPLAYLGATFAASGHDLEAAGAWQTALIEGSDLSQIYLWLGDTLLRTRDLSQARNILEEATAKWPDDARFAKPMALVYATFGRGRDAVRTLQRHIEANPNDLDVLRLAIEWIYHLHSSGIAAGTRADDIKLARAYGETYEKLRGPQLPLVREWIQYLERGGP
jgi:tetratricopeptide (TPR) repeat protein